MFGNFTYDLPVTTPTPVTIARTVTARKTDAERRWTAARRRDAIRNGMRPGTPLTRAELAAQAGPVHTCSSQCDGCHTLANCVPAVTRAGDLLLCAACAESLVTR
jgi:hypothetical protein